MFCVYLYDVLRIKVLHRLGHVYINFTTVAKLAILVTSPGENRSCL